MKILRRAEMMILRVASITLLIIIIIKLILHELRS